MSDPTWAEVYSEKNQCEHGHPRSQACEDCATQTERDRCRAWAFKLLGALPDGNAMISAIEGGEWPKP